jgi:hypothetical protein
MTSFYRRGWAVDYFLGGHSALWYHRIPAEITFFEVLLEVVVAALAARHSDELEVGREALLHHIPCSQAPRSAIAP